MSRNGALPLPAKRTIQPPWPMPMLTAFSGRERAYLASRWTAPDPANPNYQALKLYRNYDGQHHGFATTSVSDTNNGSANLFSSYAALNSTGTSLTVLVLNKNPSGFVQAQFAINGFTPQQVTTYTLSPLNPTRIVASAPRAWSSVIGFAPYTATLLVVSGTAQMPSAEWDLNPDTTMVAAGGRVVLQPRIVSGSGTVTLGTPQSDSGIIVLVTQPHLTSGQNGSITVIAGINPGFYHFTVPSTDNTGVTPKAEWLDCGGKSASVVHQDRRQSNRHDRQPVESRSDTQPRQFGRECGWRDGSVHYQRRFAIESHRHHRFVRQCACRADVAFESRDRTRDR